MGLEGKVNARVEIEVCDVSLGALALVTGRTAVPKRSSPAAASNLLCSAPTISRSARTAPSSTPAAPSESSEPKVRGPMPVPGAHARGVFA